MTSANVTYFKVSNRATGEKFKYRQHHFCKIKIWEQLLKHIPYSDFDIVVVWPNEEEEEEIFYDGGLEGFLRENGKI